MRRSHHRWTAAICTANSPLTADERRAHPQRAQTPHPLSARRRINTVLRRDQCLSSAASRNPQRWQTRPGMSGQRGRACGFQPAGKPPTGTPSVGPVITSKHATAAQELRRKRESEATLQGSWTATEEKRCLRGPAKLDVVDDGGDEFYGA